MKSLGWWKLYCTHADGVLMQDIGEHLTTVYLSHCERGRRCLYEGSTPPGGFPNSWVIVLSPHVLELWLLPHFCSIFLLFFVLNFSPVFLLPGSSVLIWNSLFDFKKSFEPCSGCPNHEYGNFLILMSYIMFNVAF